MAINPKQLAEWKALAAKPSRCACSRTEVSPVGEPPHPRTTDDDWLHTFGGCGPVGAVPTPTPSGGHPELAAAVPALIAEVERLTLACNLKDEAIEVARRELAARDAVLREVEWGEQAAYGHEWLGCPLCGGEKDAGHAPDCRLSALLRSTTARTP